MSNRPRIPIVALAIFGSAGILCAARCSHSNPTQPSTASSFVAPLSLAPVDHARLRNMDQPVTLSVQNAVATEPATTTYIFEVATDSALSTKVQTSGNVAEGAGGQTLMKLNMLPADKDYYWHARATHGGVVGPFGATRTFNIGPAIVLSPPVAVGPLTGAVATSRPTFTVADIVRVGSAGPLTYTFEVASNPGFSPDAVTGAVPEGSGRTSFTPASDLASNVTYFWRATAVDQTNSLSSPPSVVQVFTAAARTRQFDLALQLGVPLWPGVEPSGSNGQAVLGDNWNVQTLYYAPGMINFVSPTIEELRLFDLMDRGLSPDGAISWMGANGYPTTAQYYPAANVIGVPYEYIAFISGRWDLVLRSE